MCDKELSQQAKDYFAQIRKTDRLIQRLSSTVATLRSSLNAQSYDLKPDKVQGSSAKSPFESTVIKIIDLEEKINARIDELATMRNDTFSMIKNVPDLEQQNILIGRYIQLKEWDDIAAELKFSAKWILKLHGKALLEFSKGNQEFFEKRVKATSGG